MTNTSLCPAESALPPILEHSHAYRPHRPLLVNRHAVNLGQIEASQRPNYASLECLPNRQISFQDDNEQATNTYSDRYSHYGHLLLVFHPTPYLEFSHSPQNRHPSNFWLIEA